jgi:hypothetical protein
VLLSCRQDAYATFSSRFKMNCLRRAPLDSLSEMKLKIGSRIEWLLRVENLPFSILFLLSLLSLISRLWLIRH